MVFMPCALISRISPGLFNVKGTIDTFNKRAHGGKSSPNVFKYCLISRRERERGRCSGRK